MIAAAGRLEPQAPCRLRLAAGRIVAAEPLAGAAEPPAGPAARDGAELGDARALLLPAFADPHVHLVACAADRAGLDLGDDPPAAIDDLLARLRTAARALPPGTWLRAAGYDEAWLAERRPPTRAELDRALPEHPLRLRHATRHATLLNSLGWARVEQALGSPGAARAPRDAAGRPLGVVYGLEPEITRVVGPLDAATLAGALAEVGAALARHGVVAADDVTASNDRSRVARLAAAVESGDLPQQLRVYVADADEVEPARAAAGGRVAIAGVKLLARSTDEVQSRSFVERVVRARRAGQQLAVHAVEPDVTAAVLDALEVAPPRRGDATSPDRIEHASLCPPELARRIAAAGVAVVTQPAFVAWRGDKYRSEVEPPLWDWLYPLRALAAAGVQVAASSDAPVVPLDPRLGLDAAVRRTTRAGAALGEAQALDEAAALALFGAAPARLRGAPAPFGLVAGAAADLLVVEPDSWAARWRGLAIRHTVSAGRVIA